MSKEKVKKIFQLYLMSIVENMKMCLGSLNLGQNMRMFPKVKVEMSFGSRFMNVIRL